MDKDRSRGIRRHHRARVLVKRAVASRFAEAAHDGQFGPWFRKASFDPVAELKFLMVDEGRRSYWDYGHSDCPCYASNYTDRKSCRGCIRRARWQAGEHGMDDEYQDWRMHG